MGLVPFEEGEIKPQNDGKAWNNRAIAGGRSLGYPIPVANFLVQFFSVCEHLGQWNRSEYTGNRCITRTAVCI